MEEQNSNTPSGVGQEIPQNNVSMKTSGSGGFKSFSLKKVVFVMVGLILVTLIIISTVMIVKNKSEKAKNDDSASKDQVAKEESELIEQNKRLAGFYGREQTPVDDPKIIESRKKILEYAKSNSITVTDEEISERKKELISNSSQNDIDQTLQKYGWSDADWTEVVRWQILREKILLKIKPNRFGEVLSVRWDVYSPTLNQQVADERKVAASQYLNEVTLKLKSGAVKDLYTISESFDISAEPVFKGLEDKYALQYSGWDEEKKSYKEFLLTPDNANYSMVMSTVPPTVTEINCTLGGCQIYNITSGTNGDESESEILKSLTDGSIPF